MARFIRYSIGQNGFALISENCLLLISKPLFSFCYPVGPNRLLFSVSPKLLASYVISQVPHHRDQNILWRAHKSHLDRCLRCNKQTHYIRLSSRKGADPIFRLLPNLKRTLRVPYNSPCKICQNEKSSIWLIHPLDYYPARYQLNCLIEYNEWYCC